MQLAAAIKPYDLLYNRKNLRCQETSRCSSRLKQAIDIPLAVGETSAHDLGGNHLFAGGSSGHSSGGLLPITGGNLAAAERSPRWVRRTKFPLAPHCVTTGPGCHREFCHVSAAIPAVLDPRVLPPAFSPAWPREEKLVRGTRMAIASLTRTVRDWDALLMSQCSQNSLRSQSRQNGRHAEDCLMARSSDY